MRIDVLMTAKGLVRSRQKARELILAGRVSIIDKMGRRKVSKPSLIVDDSPDLKVEIAADPEFGEREFVSRGALKLSGALERCNRALNGRTVLDIGISTGGFADCCLQRGANRIVGVDVGHDQLAQKLRDDSRVVLFEGVNARDLVEPEWQTKLFTENSGQKFDLIVVDVSFISLRLVLPGLPAFLLPTGAILALVKPQFEVGRAGLGKGGIVNDASLYPKVESEICVFSTSLGLKVESYFESSILGSDGNREFFLYATTPQTGFF